MIRKSTVTVYYATPIRGNMGADATVEYMATNCARAKRNVEVLQTMFPEIEWVSVAPYDRIVQKLLARKQVKIQDVLQADFEVGDECDGLLEHLWEPSGGADEEFERQSDRGKMCLKLMHATDWQIWKCNIPDLEQFVKDVMMKVLPYY